MVSIGGQMDHGIRSRGVPSANFLPSVRVQSITTVLVPTFELRADVIYRFCFHLNPFKLPSVHQ